MSAETLGYTRSSFVARHSVASYFVLTFAISWLGAVVVAAPHLLRREPLPQITGILMFPAMLLGPSVAGILLTQLIDGREGLRDLSCRMRQWRFPLRWYAALLIPPCFILAVLLLLKTLVSPVYTPNWFLVGVLFGVPAGFLEEIGWMGYAFRRIRSRNGAVAGSILLGLLWSLWHLPVINYLGTATPHGSYWLPFFLAFAFVMTAMRILICWMYSHTKSVLLAQLMHASSTGSLVFFSPPRVSPAQEVFWYAIYGVALWLMAGVVAARMGNTDGASGR